MKKIAVLVSVMVFALTFGASAMEIGNGISLTGVSADDGAILSPVAHAEDMYVEGSSAGGLRPDKEVWNGITVIEPAAPAGYGKDLEVSNGITAFRGGDELF